MKNDLILKSLFAGMVCGLIALGHASPSSAQEAQPAPPPPPVIVQPSPPPPPMVIMPPPPPPPMVIMPPMPLRYPPPIDTTGRFKLNLQGNFGSGFDTVDIGVTTRGDTVQLSGGGGDGGSFGIGYGLSPYLDLDLDFGIQTSYLTPDVSNADGTFKRSFVLVTIKRKMPVFYSGQFKLGIGLGDYVDGKLDVNTRQVGGSHTVVNYKDALGAHLTGEFEWFFVGNTSLHAGLKLYFVNYKADSATVNNSSVPVGSLNGSVKDFGGSGMDFMLGVSQYF